MPKVTIIHPYLDEVAETFNNNSNTETAFTLIEVVCSYWKDGMVSDKTATQHLINAVKWLEDNHA